MKIKKKVIIPLAIVLVGALGGGYAVAVNSAKPTIVTVDTYTAQVMDLSNSVSVTGTVESDNTVNVYTTLNYPIQTVAVEVGDKVAEGDLLCQLDTKNLEANIAKSQASVYAAQSKAKFSVEMAEKAAETAKYNVAEDYDTALLNAEAQIKSAESNLLSKQHTAAEARKDLRDLRDDKKQVNDDETYDQAIEKTQRTLVQAEIAIESAQQGLEDAKANLAAVKQGKKDAAVNNEDAITSAKLNNNFNDQYIAIQQLQSDLAEAAIIAPMSGTVTAVYAKEGATGAGLLFVIEDTSKLKVVTKVKEYDISFVTEGQPVTVKSDGTGDQEFSGKVSRIAPTTAKNATGGTVSSTNAEFETEIVIDSDSKLRVGMNARLNIITEEKKSVMAVPYEALTLNEAGDSIVFVMDPQEDGTFVAKSIPVTAGLETDFSTEVISDGLREGDIVITTPEGLVDGTLVKQLDQAAIQQAILA